MPQLRNTRHSKQRLHERQNLSKKNEVKDILTQVPQHGKNPEEFAGEFRDFLIVKRGKPEKRIKIKVYNNNIYIYRNHSLITSYPVPKRFLPVEQWYPMSGSLKHKSNILKTNVDIESYDIRVIGSNKDYVAALYVDNVFECFGTGTNINDAKENALDTYFKIKDITL